jgi:hypothetical protein
LRKSTIRRDTQRSVEPSEKKAKHKQKKEALLTNEEEGVYTVKDPMLRKLLLTSQIT